MSKALLRRLSLQLDGDSRAAERILRDTLQLAPLRNSADSKRKSAQHTKIISVDDAAFYIGSRNLYPSWLQEHGYIVEDRAAAQQLKKEFFDPQWNYSQTVATYDWAKKKPSSVWSWIHDKIKGG